MRNPSIESGQERLEINLSAQAVGPQELSLLRDIDRKVIAKLAEFSPEAKIYWVDKVCAFAEQSIVNSVANAEEEGADLVSKKNVERAISQQHPVPPGSFRKFARVFGGLLLGAGISALAAILISGPMTKTGLILVFVLSAAGGFLIAFEK